MKKYLNTHKGIHCHPEQIIICGGTKDAVRLIALSLRQDIHTLLMESPGVPFVPKIFQSLGYGITPIPVDNTGIITDKLEYRQQAILYTSAAHQFPLGGTLTIERRYELIDFAARNGHYIIEDDCDSEFRYRGAPVNSLFQLNSENILHLGTFSKTICPALRLGYIVIPEKLSQMLSRNIELLGNPPCTINQGIVNELIRNGDYEKHIYKMTKLYKAKVKTMTENLHRVFPDNILINGDCSGLHIAIRFKNYTFKAKDKAILNRHNLDTEFSNDFRLKKNNSRDNRLILSFSHLDQVEIIQAINQLQAAYTEMKA